MRRKNNQVKKAPPRKYTIEQLEDAVLNNRCLTDVLRQLTIDLCQESRDSVMNRIEALSLCMKHWYTEEQHGLYRFCSTYLKKSDTFIDSNRLKRKLFSERILKEECSICGLEGVWNGKPLKVQLDHINGDNTDNRIENLRILCLNCHSQTSTHGARNIKNRRDRRGSNS